MKITELMESTDKLVAYLNKNSEYLQPFGNSYVFLWTDSTLRSMIKAGAKVSDDLSTVTTPGEIGIGIVNAATGHLCVGAIDQDYDALWASSTDVSDFFASTKNKTLIRLPGRLQNLADMLARQSSGDDTGGVDAILKYIDEEGMENIDVDAIKDMNSGDEVKEYLEYQLTNLNNIQKSNEDEHDRLLNQFDTLVDNNASNEEIMKIRQKIRKLSGNNESTIFEIENILKERHLFTDSDSDEDDTSDVASEIDKWTNNFNRDFPNFDISDAREFDPNL
jgi:hypothetical protein